MCDECGSKYNDIGELNMHVNTEHSGEKEHNCNDCSFQASCREQLEKYLSLAHHNISPGCSNTKNAISCHTCGDKFESKQKLMIHRRGSHPERIRTSKRTCAYKDSVCWYNHDLSQEEDSKETYHAETEYRCKFCESVFKSKTELMRHRKVNHPQVILKCRDFDQGFCRFQEDDCWYNHSHNQEPIENETQNSYFHRNQQMHPPDLIQRIMTMMENVMMRVGNMEKTQNMQ